MANDHVHEWDDEPEPGNLEILIVAEDSCKRTSVILLYNNTYKV
eukprot:CAMPEP_0119029896 /NCGR_PEP_ID=MMETSP1176-20130426/40756_1 /TAXON_ID=265551 /ORGANISM="Synedropsis recta cf, Strain CCMP1620" /LENGTH=43 /DNA_ID= /DNA_START= /DNA_END= /DNA_ORIENTATION=